MVYHLPQHLGAQISFPDFFVPVFMALKRILRIVDVDCIQLFQTYDLVKFLQNPIQIPCNIVSCIINMAGIKADSDFLFTLYLFYDIRQFLKTAAHFRAFP